MYRVLEKIAFALVAVGTACAADPPWIARSASGMVASDSPEASQVGADVLAAGGNAFDAAIATSFALTVTRPQSTGLGGGGFMVAWLGREQRAVALDFRETAPAQATRDRYMKLFAERGDGPSPTVHGGAAVAVPGQLAGLAEIHKRYATRPLRDLIEPAIKLAEEGFVVDEHYEDACAKVLRDMEKWPQLREQHAEIHATLLGGGKPPRVGDALRRPQLVDALTLVQHDGADAFRKGPLAEAIVRTTQSAGGVLTLDDLAGYRVREREPLRARRGHYEIVTMPPPSSGGVCLIEALNIFDCIQQHENQLGASNWPSGQFASVLVISLKHAFADRARWLGDPDCAPVPVRTLTSPKYACSLSTGSTARIDGFGSTKLPDDGGTSHFCIADRAGNIVTLTETINGFFGSLVIAEPYGILLNNEMDDFAANPGNTNMYALVQGEANAIAPGKRPLSSMTPTIVLKDGKPVLTLGGSGGPRIITSVLQVLMHVLDHEMSLEAAVAAPRLHHQWQPDEVTFDRVPPAEILAALQQAGLTINPKRNAGIVQAIQFLPDGTMIGASDPRKDGRPAGVK